MLEYALPFDLVSLLRAFLDHELELSDLLLDFDSVVTQLVGFAALVDPIDVFA